MDFNNVGKIRKLGRVTDWWEYSTHIFSDRFVALIQHTKITPDHLTVASLITATIASYFILFGNYSGLVLAAILLQISFILDCADGTLARHKKLFSFYGSWFDSFTDRVKEFLVILSLTLKYSHVSNSAIFFGLYSLFLIFLYHGQEIAKLSLADDEKQLSEKETDSGVIKTLINLRKRLKIGPFNIGEQYFTIVLFLLLNRIDLLFYVFTIYGTFSLIVIHLYKINCLRCKR